MHYRIYYKKIIINFVTKLLKLINFVIKEIYNSILIITDQLIKYFYMILFKKQYNAKQLKFLILNRLIQYYKISKTIISDKNKFFTFNY